MAKKGTKNVENKIRFVNVIKNEINPLKSGNKVTGYIIIN